MQRELCGCFLLPIWGVIVWRKGLVAVSKLDAEEVTQFIQLLSDIGTKMTFTEDGNGTKLIPPPRNFKMPSHNTLPWV